MSSPGILFHSAETVFTFVLIGALGYHLAKIGWFNRDASALFSRLLAKVVIPVSLFHNIMTAMTREEFLANAGSILVPLASIVLALGVGWAVAVLAKVPRGRRNIFIVCFGVSNTINIGLPINTALFGDGALPAILMYYMANTIAFWTICNCLLSADSKTREPAPVLSLTTVKRMFSPSFLAFIFGSALLLAGVPVPAALGNAMKHVGSIMMPLSTMCVGVAIFETGIRNIRVDRELVLLCLGRFAAAPAILAALLHFAPAPELTYRVFMIQGSLPPPMAVALLTIFYRTEPEYASVTISFATLCAIVTVPAYMLILG